VQSLSLPYLLATPRNRALHRDWAHRIVSMMSMLGYSETASNRPLSDAILLRAGTLMFSSSEKQNSSCSHSISPHNAEKDNCVDEVKPFSFDCADKEGQSFSLFLSILDYEEPLASVLPSYNGSYHQCQEPQSPVTSQ
jgi:hypothetical protein